MPRHSRSRRRRRAAAAGQAERARQKVALRERRIRQAERIDPTMDAVSAATRQNPAMLGPILTSIYGTRRNGVLVDQTLLPMETWYTLARIPLADHILSRTGATWSPSKDVIACVSWPATLRWALDYYVYAMHLVRAQKLVAAAMAVRMYLERWTLNLANDQQIAPGEAETDGAFFTRTWSVYTEVAQQHDMGLYWRWLSEYLHGRPELRSAWATHLDYASGMAADYADAGKKMAVIASTTFIQALGAIQTYAVDNGLDDLAPTLFKYPVNPKTHTTWEEGPIVASSLHPMDIIFVGTEAATTLSAEGARYREFVRDPRSAEVLKNSIALVHAQMAYVERRGRAVDLARSAFDEEAETYGDAFDPRLLPARLFRYIGIAEMARLCAEANCATDAERRALHAAADALESGWYAWLEDTDLTLGCARVMLEQTARVRAHRLKKARAQNLEELMVASPPSRWLELAGFKRLSSYNIALGHFSHIRQNVRISGARRLLVQVQSGPSEHAAHTARGDVLDEAAYLLAHETLARLDTQDCELAQRFREAVTLHDADGHEARLADMLQRSLALRGEDLGAADFVQQPADG